VDPDLGLVHVRVSGKIATIDHMTDSVTSEDAAMRQRVDKARFRMLQAMRPCPCDEDAPAVT
jgi:hypothetical protein